MSPYSVDEWPARQLFIFFVQLIQTCSFVPRCSRATIWWLIHLADILLYWKLSSHNLQFLASLRPVFCPNQALPTLPRVPASVISICCTFSLRRIRTKTPVFSSDVSQAPIVPCTLFSLNQLNHFWQVPSQFAGRFATVIFFGFGLFLSFVWDSFATTDRHEIQFPRRCFFLLHSPVSSRCSYFSICYCWVLSWVFFFFASKPCGGKKQ